MRSDKPVRKKSTRSASRPGSNVVPKRKKRKRRYDPTRLAIVLVAICIAVGLVGYGGYAGMRAVAGLFSSKPAENAGASLSSASSSASSKTSSSSQASQAGVNGITAKELEKLNAVKSEIERSTSGAELADLKAQILDYLNSHNIDQSKFSWSVMDLTTDAYIESDNAKTNFTAASTYKLPLCMYYYEEIEAGRINPNDSLEYSEEMREEEDKENLNQPIHRKFKVGDKIQIDELLEAALLYSDNIAGHMLYENLGGYEKFKELVSKYSPSPQAPEFYNESYNVLNADYTMHLLYKLYKTPGTFNDLKYWLQNASLNTFLNRDLSGHYIQKIGNINAVRNALAISNGPAPFSISIFSSIGKKEGLNAIADLGVLVNNYFVNKYNSGYYANQDAAYINMLNSQMSAPVDVIYYRPGPEGQTLPDLTSEEQSMAEEAAEED